MKTRSQSKTLLDFNYIEVFDRTVIFLVSFALRGLFASPTLPMLSDLLSWLSYHNACSRSPDTSTSGSPKQQLGSVSLLGETRTGCKVRTWALQRVIAIPPDAFSIIQDFRPLTIIRQTDHQNPCWATLPTCRRNPGWEHS